MQISSTTRSLVFLPSILMSLFENWKYIWSPNAQYKASKPFAKWILTYNLTSNLSMDQIPVMKISKKTFLYSNHEHLANSVFWSLYAHNSARDVKSSMFSSRILLIPQLTHCLKISRLYTFCFIEKTQHDSFLLMTKWS